jgi:hypothetical protein
MISFFFNMVMAVFMFGRAIAYDQIFSPQLYSIITHDSTISDAALVRSSSMGFIISINGTIMFLPTGEIRQIIAKKKLEQN